VQSLSDTHLAPNPVPALAPPAPVPASALSPLELLVLLHEANSQVATLKVRNAHWNLC
jgi:hypothetical protein